MSSNAKESEEFYLIIYSSDDGTYITRTDKTGVLNYLNDGESHKILGDLPPFEDGYFMKQGTIILKARVVVPGIVEKATEYAL